MGNEPGGPGPGDRASAVRRAELAERLHQVRERIATACSVAGRDAAEITLVAITKTRPASDVRLLYELGQRDFGENRDQEAAPKAAECADLPITWHFVGQLQTNKASSVAGYADVVHSVDRVRLVRALGAAARKAGRELTCLVQVDLDTPADPARGGVPPGQVREIAEAIEAEQNLILGGVMAIAPLGADPVRAFAPLRPCSLAVRAVNPAAAIISAGMSGDLEAAIGNGATHVRIGTALLGARRPLVR
ncbi:MAG: YggS family pyridoxal phosphate-dependent enzyme [Trebonia sp.]